MLYILLFQKLNKYMHTGDTLLGFDNRHCRHLWGLAREIEKGTKREREREALMGQNNCLSPLPLHELNCQAFDIHDSELGFRVISLHLETSWN